MKNTSFWTMNYRFKNQVHWLPSPFLTPTASRGQSHREAGTVLCMQSSAHCLSSLRWRLLSAVWMVEPTQAHRHAGPGATSSPGIARQTALCWPCLVFAKTSYHKCALPPNCDSGADRWGLLQNECSLPGSSSSQPSSLQDCVSCPRWSSQYFWMIQGLHSPQRHRAGDPSPLQPVKGVWSCRGLPQSDQVCKRGSWVSPSLKPWLSISQNKSLRNMEASWALQILYLWSFCSEKFIEFR